MNVVSTDQPAYVNLRKLCHDDHKTLRRRLASVLKEPSDIDDVIQDAYIRIMEIKATNTSIDNPPAFMYRVCMNLALDRIRYLHRRERLFISDSCEDISIMVENQPCHSPTPEEHCARDELSNEMMTVLEDLPQKCRQAFLLKQFWDFNYQEIAIDMDLSVSMIEKYVKRASTHVRKCFAEN